MADEVARPLDLDVYIGLPESEIGRVAPLITESPDKVFVRTLAQGLVPSDIRPQLLGEQNILDSIDYEGLPPCPCPIAFDTRLSRIH